MDAPNLKNYVEWVKARAARTEAACTRPRITGREIRLEGLSMARLYQFGYVLDTATDTMVKNGN